MSDSLSSSTFQLFQTRDAQDRGVLGTSSASVTPSGADAACAKQSPELRARLQTAKARLESAALRGERIRAYEVALDLDLSEFHFARQFRIAFDCSPHAFYDEMRAVRARELLGKGQPEGVVARSVGFRRPAELRALLQKRGVSSAA